ncbi:MAG: hypothetical protein JWP66_1095 [Naasia sp.]|nr:hypothetical protein [Naasia sp.]
MSLAALSTEVVVWFSNGVPARLVRDGVRYRVTDTPTPLTEDAWCPPMTHAAPRLIGWRFQGTAANGASLMFEIVEAQHTWHVLRTYV